MFFKHFYKLGIDKILIVEEDSYYVFNNNNEYVYLQNI